MSIKDKFTNAVESGLTGAGISTAVLVVGTVALACIAPFPTAVALLGLALPAGGFTQAAAMALGLTAAFGAATGATASIAADTIQDFKSKPSNGFKR